MKFRRVRTRLLFVVLTAVSLGLVAATIGFNVLIASSTDSTEISRLRAHANEERALLGIQKGVPVPGDVAGDTLGEARTWIFAGTRLVQAPRVNPETMAAAVTLSTGPSRFHTLEDSHERLFSLPIRDHGKRIGTIVTGISLSPYDETKRNALLASLAFAASVLVISMGAAAWLLRSALLPVALMTQQAETWSEQDLDRRFGFDDPHDELTGLGYTLDRLLDRISASLRHERRFSAELSHELRTPLAKLTAEAELALRRPRTPEEYRQALAGVHEHAQQIARIVDTLLAAARQEASPVGVADAADVAYAAADACRPLADDLGVDVAISEEDGPVRVGVDPDLAERILHPVLDNACRYARSRVTVSLARSDGVVLFSVADDGPGVGAEEIDAIFEPAMRGEAGRRTGPSAGLGLALARRLARSAAGDVQAEASNGGGRFTVRLPAA
jgi:two-component system, OmpR family, sensor kinase